MEQQEHQQCTSLQPLFVNQRVLVKNPITKSWDDRESSPKCDHLVNLVKCLWTLVKPFYGTELSFVLSLLIINPWKLHYPWQLHQNSHLPTFPNQNASLRENNEADVNPSSPPGGNCRIAQSLSLCKSYICLPQNWHCHKIDFATGLALPQFWLCHSFGQEYK